MSVVAAATNPGSGYFTPTNAVNDFTTVSTSNQVNTVSLRDDSGFDIGAAGLSAAASVTLQTDGTITQTGAVTTGTLTLTATTAGSGDFTLNSVDDTFTDVSVTNQVNTVALRN